MAESSSGSSGRPPSHLGATSGECEACATPCNRGCAPGECTIKFPKACEITIRGDSIRGGPLSLEIGGNGRKLSLDNVLRTLSNNVEVERVEIQFGLDDEKFEAPGKVLKPLFECMKSVPHLKSLKLVDLDSESLSVADAQLIFSFLVDNSVLQSFDLQCDWFSRCPTNPAVIAVLVDALLQNQFLQQFFFQGNAHGAFDDTTASEGNTDILRELRRYSTAPKNVLTKLRLFGLTDIQVQQVADMLRDNQQLKHLKIHRSGRRESLEDLQEERRSSNQYGIGLGIIGEALRNNTVLERLEIWETVIEAEEMRMLVRALQVPDASGSRHQPNTSLLHLSFISRCSVGPGGEKEWMEHLTTMLRSNASLISLNLNLDLMDSTNKDNVEYVEMLFTSLWSNTSLEELVLRGCFEIRGKQMMGIIGDMLLHNHTLMNIDLFTGAEHDGSMELVHAELRARKKNTNLGLMKLLEGMEHVPPNSARIFLCGSGNAGKTTLCKKWRHIFKSNEKGNMKIYEKLRQIFLKDDDKGEIQRTTIPPDRTCGIEVHKIVWSDINITMWDMAGQTEYHAFHDLVLPNQYAYGGSCIYFIVCNPWEKEPQAVEDDIRYWLVFVASNTRRTKSYRPRVTILMTHHDLWGNNSIFMHLLKKRVIKLRKMFQHVLDFDYNFEFIEMDNNNQSHYDAMRVKQIIEEYLKEMSSKLPKILKASVELQSLIAKWNENHLDKPILRWDEFSNGLCEEVKEVRKLKELAMGDKEFLEKAKKFIASSLHDGGHIMYYEGLSMDIGSMVITNPHWFCHNVMGIILFKCSGLDPKYGITSNGVITRENLQLVCRDMPTKDVGKKKKNAKKSYALMSYIEQHFDEILGMMIKLQICYIDGNDARNIMIPAILSDEPSSLSWPNLDPTTKLVYRGTRLMSKDDTITSMTIGFFPRLQVYLHNKYTTPSYKLYYNIIYFIHKDIHIFITFNDGSINIMSQSSQEQDHDVHKMIMDDINDFRAKFSSLGCPGVIFKEDIIWPRCVEHCLSSKDPRFQTVSKKELKKILQSCRDLKYIHHWKWDEHWQCAGCDSAEVLLGGEEWKNILQTLKHELKEVDNPINSIYDFAPIDSKQEECLLVFKDINYHMIPNAHDEGNLKDRCLELIAESKREEQKWTSHDQEYQYKPEFNNEQCDYLLDKIKVAFKSANMSLQNNCQSRSLGKDIVKHLEILKLLLVMDKEVESFIKGCCGNEWLQATMTMTNVSEHVSAIGFNLELCKIAISEMEIGRVAGSLAWTEVFQISMKEVDIVKKKACIDDENLKKKVIENQRILIGEERELAIFVLERLYKCQSTNPNLSGLSSLWESFQRFFPKFQPTVEIGKGATATVQKSMWMGKEVAKKLFNGSDNVEFKKEISNLAGLFHANVMTFLCCGVDKESCSIIMELMTGDLHSLMQERLVRGKADRDYPFSIFEAVDIILQIAEGMEYVHSKKIVHRDLKSGNILVKATKGECGYVRAKVGDFGLSKKIESSCTHSNQTHNVGTSRWIAPEVIKFYNDNQQSVESEDLKYPFRSDVYSFAMLCYEILTGKVPFFECGLNLNEVKKKVLCGERPPLPNHCPSILKTLIEECWNSKPKQRPTFGEICMRLKYLKYLLVTMHGKKICNTKLRILAKLLS